MILDDGLQPSMLCTKSGTLVVQSQLSKKPHPQERIFYPYALETVVSRDGGQTWTEFPLKPGDNGVNHRRGHGSAARRHHPGPRNVRHARRTSGRRPGAALFVDRRLSHARRPGRNHVRPAGREFLTAPPTTAAGRMRPCDCTAASSSCRAATCSPRSTAGWRGTTSPRAIRPR